MVKFSSKNNRFASLHKWGQLLYYQKKITIGSIPLKTFSPLGEKIEFCFQYSFSQNTSIIWKCKLAWGRQWTSWTHCFVSLKFKREEIWKPQTQITSSEFTSDFHRFNRSAAPGLGWLRSQLHYSRMLFEKELLAVCGALNPELIKGNMQLGFKKAFSDCEGLQTLRAWILLFIPCVFSPPF